MINVYIHNYNRIIPGNWDFNIIGITMKTYEPPIHRKKRIRCMIRPILGINVVFPKRTLAFARYVHEVW